MAQLLKLSFWRILLWFGVISRGLNIQGSPSKHGHLYIQGNAIPCDTVLVVVVSCREF